MLAEDEMVCTRCGRLKSECSDPNVTWYPQRTMCYATAVTDLTYRRLRDRHKENEPGLDLHPTDGMDLWVSTVNLTPDDQFI